MFFSKTTCISLKIFFYCNRELQNKYKTNRPFLPSKKSLHRFYILPDQQGGYLPENNKNFSSISKSKLPGQVRNLLRAKHNSLITEKPYITRIKQYILFPNKRHPLEMAEVDNGTSKRNYGNSHIERL